MDTDERNLWVGTFCLIAGALNLVAGHSLSFRFLGFGLVIYGARRVFDWWRAGRSN